ncbi:MAG: hypothetical protein HC915_04220 [Anaerolineae bacterium]|nr:hypothetical protein [Anaerolineae bacterium]
MVRGILAGSGLAMGVLLLGVFVITGVMLGTYFYYARELPPPSAIAQVQDQAYVTTVLYDRTGQQVLYEIVPPEEGDRQRVALSDLPPYVLSATVAIEDASFYNNPGFDPRGIARALWANMTGGRIQGGSTITQQLVKNTLLEEEERTAISVDRKIKEIILASEISRLYSKDQILEWYLNTNFYGNLAYGIEAAARVYLSKSARELTLAEAALLVAIPQFPAQNPIDNPAGARLRQGLVLNRMAQLGYITPAEAEAALADQIVIRPLSDRFDIRAPHFSLYARAEAESLLNQRGLDGAFLISRGGLRIYTTLDLDLQEQLECVSRTHVSRLDGASPDFVHNTRMGAPCAAADYLQSVSPELAGLEREVTNAAGVVLRAETGEIRAMLGSVNFWDEGIDGNFNVALAERQPGSVFKPIVYLTAFVTPVDGRPITPATMTMDVALEFEGSAPVYVPRNIDGRYHGPVSIREALANSYNVPPVQVLSWVGLSPVIRNAHRLGINSLNDSLNAYGLSLALGAGEVSLLDMTYVYNVFNTQGYWVGTPVHASQARQGYRQLNPTAILRIEDADGNILWEFSEQRGTYDRRPVFPAGMTYLITDILADREARLRAFAPGNPLELSRPAAAKTGTTDENRDSWTVGYTPQYTTGIWVGNNDNRSMTDITGISGAAPIWNAIMEYLHARDALPVQSWERPSTVVEQTVCLWSGLLPTPECTQVPGELFYVDVVNGVDYRPQERDRFWYRLAVDACNNTRANETTPVQCLEERIFFDFPPELQTWAGENVPEMLPPVEAGLLTEGSQFSPVALVDPRFPDQVGGVVEVYGNTNIEDLAYYQLYFGQGTDPETFVEVGEQGSTSAFNHALANWDTTTLEDGVYTLRLQAVQNNNRVQNVSTRVTVDNTPPEVRLSEPLEAATYSAEADVFVELVAEVFDAGDVERVRFWVDAPVDAETSEPILIEENAIFPYVAQWIIEDSGLRTFWVEAYDRAGNRAESNRVIVNLIE